MKDSLEDTFNRYRGSFRTKTNDSSAYGWTMLKGYLLLETDRNYVNIDQAVNGPDADGQNLQHFMSDSPWRAQSVFDQVYSDINTIEDLGGGTLNFDESGDECSGDGKAGAARQYLGRHGKVDMGQVGVLSSYSKSGVWLLTDAELYLPKKWFSDEQLLKKWKRLHIPAERTFKTKLELAQQLFDRALAQNLDFEWTGADSLYGQSIHFRRYIANKGKRYMMSIPKDERVWLSNPLVSDADTDVETSTIDENSIKTVQQIAQNADFETIAIRHAERGEMFYQHAFIPVWTVNKNAPVEQRQARQEILLIRKESDKSLSYALTNATFEQTTKHEMAVQRAERYFVERTIQDCKSELGWDELQAQKYPAYMHTLAICAVALVFMATVKLKQREHYETAEVVQEQIGIERLPDLSLANVKELMRAVMPLPQLTPQQATQKIIDTLYKRSMATASRRRKQRKKRKRIKKLIT